MNKNDNYHIDITFNKHPSQEEFKIIEQSQNEEREICGRIHCSIDYKSYWESACFWGVTVFLFMENKKPVGFVEWRIDEENQQCVHILGFSINYKLRTNKLGTIFYEKFEDLIKKEGYNKVSLFCANNNNIARTFWVDKCKFTQCIEQNLEDEGCEYFKLLTHCSP